MRTRSVPRRTTTLKALMATGLMMGLGLFGVAGATVASSAPAAATTAKPKLVAMPHATSVPKAVPIPARGQFDCNGYSPVEAPAFHGICTDIRGFNGVDNANTWGGKFYDNGVYIGHDEPDMTFLSHKAGSGNNVTFNETLPVDPAGTPGVSKPGKDISNWYELSPAPWFSMALCDSYSYPQLPCTPLSDKNAPACDTAFTCATNAYPGAGSAVMEMQFYPPGNAPWVDNESCNGTDWCAAMTIDSLECTSLYATCQTHCEEPINFGWIQKNGVPTGPAGPGDATFNTSVPNNETLLMKPGDKISVHMFDAPAAKDAFGTTSAFEVVVDDLTQHTSGFMQASAKNGFEFVDMNCNVASANWQPEYNTAAAGNIVPWAALQTNISTEYETGHFEPCASVTNAVTNPFDPNDTGGTYTTCVGGYEGGASEGAEASDELCYAASDTHANWDGPGTTAQGAKIAACQDNFAQNGDLDFDGSPYRTEWPTGPKPTSLYPSSFVESLPTTNGTPYSQWYLQTDVALSESACTGNSLSGCTVPPHGPEVNQPGHTAFYPYWSEVDTAGTCTVEFGNVSSGTGVNDFGKDAQYGVNQFSTLGYPEFEGRIYDNTCKPVHSQGYYLAGKNGSVVAAGDAPDVGNIHGLQGTVVGIAATPTGKGYFAASNTGAVYTAGDAAFHGDLTSLGIKVSNIVAIAPTTDGGGYWLIGADGGEFAFGDAKYHGSLPGLGIHVTNIIGMVATPGGAGYLIVGSDGGVFAFGATHFYGSLPGIGVKVNNIRGILPAAAGTGYILVGSDGGAFSFGHGVPFHGSLPGEGVSVNDIVGIALTTDDGGYWMAGSNGVVYPFGDARSLKNDYNSADGAIAAISGVTTDQVNPVPGA
jgi:hypothetical protein